MATLLTTILIAVDRKNLIPLAIVVGFALDAIIVYNILKVGK
jgi:hypothetical protein